MRRVLARLRGAFSLVEVIVVIALMVTLAAVLIPGVVRSLDRARLDRAEDSLVAISTAIAAFRTDIGLFPGTLSQLPQITTTAMQSSCGLTYTAKQAMAWNGPYLNRLVPAGGIAVGVGSAQNALSHVGTELRVVVNDVTEADALVLDERVDGDGSATTGTVQWTAVGSGMVTLFWALPATAC